MEIPEKRMLATTNTQYEALDKWISQDVPFIVCAKRRPTQLSIQHRARLVLTPSSGVTGSGTRIECSTAVSPTVIASESRYKA